MVVAASDSDDNDDDWEEVDVPQDVHRHIEITLNPRQKQDTTPKKKGLSHADRLTRIYCHKIHSVCLLANGWARNAWINDPLLHARLLSLAPLSLQHAFAVITKSRVPDQNQRGRLFEAAINRLTEWWAQSFFQVTPAGHIRSRTFDEVQIQIAGLSPDALLDALEDSDDGELIRSSKSLMKHALMRTGSRDTSAQLFTALCRALGIPARLVVSLQSVPWQSGVGKHKPGTRMQLDVGKGKGKGKAQESSQESGQEDDDDEMEQVIDKKGKGKAKQGTFPGDGQSLDCSTPKRAKAKSIPAVNLRKSRSKGYTLGSSSTPPSRRQQSPDPTTTAPVFWTEVFSRPDTRWLPVDPVRNIVNKRKAFDPTPASTDRMKQENRMVYVVAFEEDGYARDVTPRYAKEYGAKVAKMQEAGGSRSGGGRRRKQWWERVVGIVRRPYRLLRDDLEDEELQVNQIMEGMPTSMAGFKDHPLYALVRHLKRDEVIHPLIELGKFRGEPVYARSAVISLKTAENWMRIGRKIKPGCQPMKWVKQRAATVNKRREIELAVERNREAAAATTGGGGVGEDVMQGLYALSQTELYKPDPVVNGKIPRNDFGNIDLYVPSMLPDGAVHLPFKGTANIARKLGFDYAEAVTGFEFKKRRAFPVIEGVVVAAENEVVLLEAYLEAEQDAEERARIKRQARVIKLWTRLVQGLRIRQRLQEEYVDKPEPAGMVNTDDDPEMLDEKIPQDVGEGSSGGGFLIGADDVVQPYHLPRYQYQPSEPHSSLGTPAVVDPDAERNGVVADGGLSARAIMYALETMDDDQDQDEDMHSDHMSTTSLPLLGNGIPKTMREMAEDAARMQSRRASGEVLSLDNDDDDEYRVSRPPAARPIATNEKKTNGKMTLRARKSATTTTKKKRERANSELEDSATPSQDGGGPSPAKRGKGSLIIDSDTSTPSSGRVLRPRSSKSAAKVREEKDLEEAFRRATARWEG